MRRPTLTVLATLSVLGLALSSPLGAEPVAWDQARITELAKQLVAELDAALAAAEEAPEQATVRLQRQRDAAIGQVTRVHQVAEKLYSELRAGRGLHQTAPYFEDALERASETYEIAGEAVRFKKSIEHWEAAGEIARKMAPYYERP